MFNEDIHPKFKKDIKREYKNWDRNRDIMKAKRAEIEKDFYGDFSDEDRRNKFFDEIAPLPKKDFEYEVPKGVEYENYPFYVTEYEENPHYHPEEGGYYIASRSPVASKGFNDIQSAKNYARGLANDYSSYYGDLIPFNDEKVSGYKTSSKYIGDDYYICVEPNDCYLYNVSHDQPYESLQEAFADNWDYKKQTIAVEFSTDKTDEIVDAESLEKLIYSDFSKNKEYSGMEIIVDVDDKEDYFSGSLTLNVSCAYKTIEKTETSDWDIEYKSNTEPIQKDQVISDLEKLGDNYNLNLEIEGSSEKFEEEEYEPDEKYDRYNEDYNSDELVSHNVKGDLTFGVFINVEGYEQEEFRGTRAECNKYIDLAQAEAEELYGNDYPDFYIKEVSDDSTNESLTESDQKYGVWSCDGENGPSEDDVYPIEEFNTKEEADAYINNWYENHPRSHISLKAGPVTEKLDENFADAGKVIIIHKEGSPENEWEIFTNGNLTDKLKNYLLTQNYDKAEEVELTQDEIYNFDKWCKENKSITEAIDQEFKASSEERIVANALEDNFGMDLETFWLDDDMMVFTADGHKFVVKKPYEKMNEPGGLSHAVFAVVSDCLDESLAEDTVKTKDGKWTNKGDEGTHGKFRTKKEADAQRRAMFANNFHEALRRDQWKELNIEDYEDSDLITTVLTDRRLTPLDNEKQRQILLDNNIHIESYCLNGVIVEGRLRDILNACKQLQISSPTKVFI